MSGFGAVLRVAAADVAEGFERRWLWGALARNDVRQRHAGSVFGSLWITANIFLMVGCLTLIFAGALGPSLRYYAPYVAIGLVLWQFIQASLNEAGNTLVANAETIRNVPAPLTLHVFRLIARNLLVMAHHLVIVPILLLGLRVMPSASAWLSLPALALLVLFVFSTSLLLALVGARFRDVSPIVTNLMQLMFFVTPIFWVPSAVAPAAGWIVALNPFFAVIDIVRTPLLGGTPLPGSWPIALAGTAAVLAAAFVTLARARSRVAYWV